MRLCIWLIRFRIVFQWNIEIETMVKGEEVNTSMENFVWGETILFVEVPGKIPVHSHRRWSTPLRQSLCSLTSVILLVTHSLNSKQSCHRHLVARRLSTFQTLVRALIILHYTHIDIGIKLNIGGLFVLISSGRCVAPLTIVAAANEYVRDKRMCTKDTYANKYKYNTTSTITLLGLRIRTCCR